MWYTEFQLIHQNNLLSHHIAGLPGFSNYQQNHCMWSLTCAKSLAYMTYMGKYPKNIGFIFFVSWSDVTNVWLTICIFFSFTQLNKRRIFLLKCLMWLSSTLLLTVEWFIQFLKNTRRWVPVSSKHSNVT